MSEWESPESEVTGGVGDTTQRELDSLDTLVHHDIHHTVIFLPLFLLIISIIFELLIVLWYWGIALMGIVNMRQRYMHRIKTRIISAAFFGSFEHKDQKCFWKLNH